MELNEAILCTSLQTTNLLLSPDSCALCKTSFCVWPNWCYFHLVYGSFNIIGCRLLMFIFSQLKLVSGSKLLLFPKHTFQKGLTFYFHWWFFQSLFLTLKGVLWQYWNHLFLMSIKEYKYHNGQAPTSSVLGLILKLGRWRKEISDMTFLSTLLCLSVLTNW